MAKKKKRHPSSTPSDQTVTTPAIEEVAAELPSEETAEASEEAAEEAATEEAAEAEEVAAEEAATEEAPEAEEVAAEEAAAEEAGLQKRPPQPTPPEESAHSDAA